MSATFDSIRRFTNATVQLGRLVSFNLEIDVELDEHEIVQELVRGYGALAGA
jgi:hypothetical protein